MSVSVSGEVANGYIALYTGVALATIGGIFLLTALVLAVVWDFNKLWADLSGRTQRDVVRRLKKANKEGHGGELNTTDIYHGFAAGNLPVQDLSKVGEDAYGEVEMPGAFALGHTNRGTVPTPRHASSTPGVGNGVGNGAPAASPLNATYAGTRLPQHQIAVGVGVGVGDHSEDIATGYLGHEGVYGEADDIATGYLDGTVDDNHEEVKTGYLTRAEYSSLSEEWGEEEEVTGILGGTVSTDEVVGDVEAIEAIEESQTGFLVSPSTVPEDTNYLNLGTMVEVTSYLPDEDVIPTEDQVTGFLDNSGTYGDLTVNSTDTEEEATGILDNDSVVTTGEIRNPIYDRENKVLIISEFSSVAL